MDFHVLTLGERNTYSVANGLAFLVTFMAVTTYASSAAPTGLVLAVAAAAGFWLTALSLLFGDLIEARDRWIGPLVFLAAIGCLLAALGESFATLIGAAGLMFILWLSHMVTESIWQAVRLRTFFADARRLSLPTQAALLAVDVAAFAGTALLMVATYGDGAHGRRLAAALVLVTPGVLVRAVRRARYRPAPDSAATPDRTARQIFVCPKATLTGRRRRLRDR
ncbi:hypothetical protein [Allorhizocola rhizosphaerae]|uniref:hypothetical protein n=1 Tax=Allorhizocola rhizosphaerae TaxID=1872709 RepID=UPI000E3D012A|nr:hypothetical protein [Allorhizocola rhizosphaerae]